MLAAGDIIPTKVICHLVYCQLLYGRGPLDTHHVAALAALHPIHRHGGVLQLLDGQAQRDAALQARRLDDHDAFLGGLRRRGVPLRLRRRVPRTVRPWAGVLASICAVVGLRRRDRRGMHWRAGGPRPGCQLGCLVDLVIQASLQRAAPLGGAPRDGGRQRQRPPPRLLGLALEAARVAQRLAEAPLGRVRRAALEAVRPEAAGKQRPGRRLPARFLLGSGLGLGLGLGVRVRSEG